MDVTAVSSLRGLAAATPATPAPAASGPSFVDMLSQLMSQGVQTIQAGESVAIQGLSGAASPFKVVEATMEAQRALQEGLSIRDKAVSAYQEISRMTI